MFTKNEQNNAGCTVTSVAESATEPGHVENLIPAAKDHIKDNLIKGLVVVSVMLITLNVWQMRQHYTGLADLAADNPVVTTGIWLCYGLIGIQVLAFFWRFACVVFYRPVRQCADSVLPSCTVIVPAYNEGKCVLDTLRSVAASDYPAEKLQIISVDDGSQDDTWQWICCGAQEHPGRIETIKFDKNRGKRAALKAGFQKSTGEIIVTIDSDSIIEKHTIRSLVSPFVNNRSIGAVAGNVRVLNTENGLIPKMLEVSFAFSFDFIRAAQSTIRSVMCTPGALSAYLRKPLMENLDEWMSQTFMGRPCTIGEDRAITNLILKSGYDVVFQSDAVVYTNVPLQYQQLCKMFLRWGRSNVRESIKMAEFIFSNFRYGSNIGARINFLLSCLNIVCWPVVLPIALLALAHFPLFFISNALFGAVSSSIVPVVFYMHRRKNTDAVWAFVYGIFWLAGLWWITPWSLLTAGNGKWLTRNLPQNSSVTATAAKINFNSVQPA